MDKKELDERFIKGAWTAMRRAAVKVVSEARQNNNEIPVWDNEKSGLSNTY